jgi:hypothetical protein
MGNHTDRKLDSSLHRITEFYTELFNVCSNIISKNCTIITSNNLVKQNNDLHKTCSYVHDFYSTTLWLRLTIRKFSP